MKNKKPESLRALRKKEYVLLFHQQQFLRLNKLPRLQAAEIYSAGKIRCIKPDSVCSDLFLFIHQFHNLSSERIVNAQ